MNGHSALRVSIVTNYGVSYLSDFIEFCLGHVCTSSSVLRSTPETAQEKTSGTQGRIALILNLNII